MSTILNLVGWVNSLQLLRSGVVDVLAHCPQIHRLGLLEVAPNRVICFTSYDLKNVGAICTENPALSNLWVGFVTGCNVASVAARPQGTDTTDDEVMCKFTRRFLAV